MQPRDADKGLEGAVAAAFRGPGVAEADSQPLRHQASPRSRVFELRRRGDDYRVGKCGSGDQSSATSILCNLGLPKCFGVFK
ncbi:hypothetical protein J1605_002879 [Eschrichtius robustus]|uniref:Uncharacterized protein n=1 Tax=Eschrichtius robustus TaxID=9764 RepID=A0AB34HWA4_ESCRO|nr:hypothetical protein J1605_002879 [Eschrichtius robustus]